LSGLIRDPDLSVGDMVFQVRQEVPVAPATPPPARVPIAKEVQQAPAGGPGEISAMIPGTTFKDCSDCPEMTVVPAGRLIMGSPETDSGRREAEGPTHEVVISRPFAVGKYEVTLGQFRQFVRETKRNMSGTCWEDKRWTPSDQHPVVCVSWDDAKAYAKWLTDKTGRPYRLLSEAEWEYAARAGTSTAYWWGDEVKQGGKIWANCKGCGGKWDGEETAPIGSFEPNAFGLYDTAGNVDEWVEDCWNDNYTGAPTDGAGWTSGNCRARVLRGGSRYGTPQNVRSAHRDMLNADFRGYDDGVRLARTLP
jgi:formylglycine-generating enzyme required for sulfatase activity